MADEVQAPEATQPPLEPEVLSDLTNEVLVEKAREMGYPPKMASKKHKKDDLIALIESGPYVETAEVETAEVEGSGQIVGGDILVPALARIIFGGPVVEGKTLPFGFTVATKLTDEELEKYGVTYHCHQGNDENMTHTYKIAYK